MKCTIFGVCVLVLLFSVSVRAQVPDQPGPEHKKLEVWAGNWTIQGEARDNPSGPTYKVSWTMHGEWLPGGFFLLINGSFKDRVGEMPWLEILGYDPVKKTHIGYVFWLQWGGTATYTMTFKDRTILTGGQGWRQVWEFSPDGLSLTGKRERGQDGKWWTAFDVKGVRSLAEKEELEKTTTAEETEAQNKKTAYLEVEKLWNEGNLDVAVQVYAPHQILHVGGKSIPFGPDIAKETVSTWRRAFPDFKFQIEDIVAEGDKLAVRYIFTGTHQGEFDGLAPTGRKVSVSQMNICRLENGKMVEAWEDYDELGMMRQLGMELRPVIPALTQTESVEQELIRLEKRWADAWVKRDVEAYARLLADDYISTNSYGDMKTKAQSIAWLKSDWREKTISLIPHDFRVRVYGDAAVINFRLTYKNQVLGKESSGQDQITDVWTKRAGRWQCVAEHVSRIAQK